MLSASSDSNDSDSGSAQRFNLRPRAMKRRFSPASRPRERTRPAPLSKYRRKTANARERFRMQEINDAFERLRNAMPCAPGDEGADAKVTKITTLRLAMDYISALARLLADAERADQRSRESRPELSLDEIYGDIQELIESDSTDLSLSDGSI